jgi:polysaccharide biosynthesis/export protein
MRLAVKPSTLLACLTGCLQLVVLSQSAPGQSPATQGGDPSEILRNLSPEQQELLMERFGGQRSDTSGGSEAERLREEPGQRIERRRRPKSIEQRKAELERDKELNPVFPILQAQDWVIIETDFFLPPRPVNLQALQNLGALTPQTLVALQGGAAPVPGVAALGATAGMAYAPSAAAPAAALAHGAAAVPGEGVAPIAGLTDTGPAYSVAGRKLNDEDRKHLQDLIDLIRSNDPYRLSLDGTLALPGFAPIPLAGLTEDQATLRLKVEPALRDVDIRLTRLPLKKLGFEGLKPFGYDLFWGETSTFAPVVNVPVPSDYVVGPGDVLLVQLYGNTNRMLTITVARDGRISLPSIGPMSVGGQLFTSVKARIEAEVERLMIGVRASVSMRDTRSIGVFVMGDVDTPGSYTISGLSTVTSALFAAGGIKPIGSMRRIELRRHGTLVRRLDLYDLLLHGNNEDDAKLQTGDVVFIPPVGPTVGVDGEVRRPAIYEVKDEQSVTEVIGLAGGLTAEADSVAVLTRINAAQERVVLSVDLQSAETRSQRVRNGDLLRVDRLRPTLDSAVLLQGHVFTSGAFAYFPGMRLSNVIHSVDQLMPGADLHYVLVRRETPPDRRVSALSVNLDSVLAARGSTADLMLQPRDRITVFDLTSGRDRIIRPLLDELRAQSSAERPPQVVHVDGRVKVPGDYPLEPGMTVADLIRAGGGLSDEAYRSRAELARYHVVDGVSRRTDLTNINLSLAEHDDRAANIVLEPYDSLSVKEVSSWGQQDTVTLTGEVHFPGRYSIREGETLKSVLARAGGLSKYAFPDGSVFLREELKRREQEQIDLLITRTQAELAAQSAQPAGYTVAGAASPLAVGQALLAQLKVAKPVGRLVIDLPRLLREPERSTADVVLRNGDRLIIPKFQQQVTVIGEVQNSTSHLYAPSIARDGYISMSGGLTATADANRIYIVRANGSVVVKEGSRWFSHGGEEIKPGDTIVVPLNVEHLPSLTFWQGVTTILYNIAVSVAALHYL